MHHKREDFTYSETQTVWYRRGWGGVCQKWCIHMSMRSSKYKQTMWRPLGDDLFANGFPTITLHTRPHETNANNFSMYKLYYSKPLFQGTLSMSAVLFYVSNISSVTAKIKFLIFKPEKWKLSKSQRVQLESSFTLWTSFLWTRLNLQISCGCSSK